MKLVINDRIRNRSVDFFNNVKINLKYDSVGSTFKLDYYFDPENIEHKELSCVGHYHIATLEHNGETLLTGTVLSINFKDSAKRGLVSIGGYSLPGVLDDCEIPISESYQLDGLSLREIATKYIKPFGLSMVVDGSVSKSMDEPYEETTAKETQTVGSYLSELASQKNIIVSHDEKGRLLFTRSLASQVPIFDFEGGKKPAIEMEFVYNGQALHSRITVFAQSGRDDIDTSEEQHVDNPFVPFVFRPKVAVQSSNNDNDTLTAAKNILANELRYIQMIIKLDRWTLGNKIVRPGKIITVLNPKVYMYRKTKWIIESVELKREADQETAVLTCIPPEAFNGNVPVYMFSGINLH